MSNTQVRTDCDAFQLKQHDNQNGDCQTDGHYLCSNCKHIAPFDSMELSDNREIYYPLQHKEELRKDENAEHVEVVSIVRYNLMNERGYTPYCGGESCKSMPRTVFKGDQFHCTSCGWTSQFTDDFIKKYKEKWKAIN